MYGKDLILKIGTKVLKENTEYSILCVFKRLICRRKKCLNYSNYHLYYLFVEYFQDVK